MQLQVNNRQTEQTGDTGTHRHQGRLPPPLLASRPWQQGQQLVHRHWQL